MSLINTHKFHALKILTFTLGLGALQPSDAAETPETTLITPSSLEIENVNTATATHPTFDENKAETETEGQINEIEKEKTQLLEEIEQLKSTYSPFKALIKSYALAGAGAAFLQFIGLPLYLSAFFSVTPATFYYLTYVETFNNKIKNINFRSSLLNLKARTLDIKINCINILSINNNFGHKY